MISTIDRNRFNDVGKHLYDLLLQIMPREDYIYFVMTLAKGDENRNIVINYIENVSNNWSDVIEFVNSKW